MIKGIIYYCSTCNDFFVKLINENHFEDSNYLCAKDNYTLEKFYIDNNLLKKLRQIN